MATSAMPMPDGGAQQAPPDPQGDQANQLQAMMMKLVAMFNTLATNNVIIQPEMQQASAACLKAFHKVTQAAQPAQQAPGAPGQ